MMRNSDFAVGQRVRLVRALRSFNIGTFAQGTTGKVVEVMSDPQAADGQITSVRLDSPHDDLAEWNIEIYVFATDTQAAEVLAEHFEVVTPPEPEETAETALKFTFVVKLRRKDWHPGRDTSRLIKAATHTEAEERAKALVGGPNASEYEVLSCITW